MNESLPPLQPPTPANYQQSTSTLALISLVMGILSYVYLPFIGAIVAVITGHFARKEIRQSNGRLLGESMASAGMVLGYVQLGVSVLIVCLVLALSALVLGGVVAMPLWCGPLPAVITIP